VAKQAGNLAELRAEINLTKQNIQLLRTAKKNCRCGGKRSHYHVLIHYDPESGDEYYETSDAKHQRFLDKLRRDLSRLEGRLAKARASV
jgi:adenine C2-methylase RlmN of 23S rRNA A2503 and tRNA A37